MRDRGIPDDAVMTRIVDQTHPVFEDGSPIRKLQNMTPLEIKLLKMLVTQRTGLQHLDMREIFNTKPPAAINRTDTQLISRSFEDEFIVIWSSEPKANEVSDPSMADKVTGEGRVIDVLASVSNIAGAEFLHQVASTVMNYFIRRFAADGQHISDKTLADMKRFIDGMHHNITDKEPNVLFIGATDDD